LLGRIPNADFDLAGLDEKNASDLLRLLHSKPQFSRIIDHFGSWLALLLEAGILEDGTRKMPRGTQCLARDGHVCLSIAEKMIDDLLTEMGISHEKEVKYPNSKLRCNFFANSVYIEYFGLTGNAEYDDKTKEKLSLGKRLRIKMLALYPEDVIQYSDLRKKLAKHLLASGDEG